MTRKQLLTYFIAAVWFANGFFCKVLGLVPRHRQIVARILGGEQAAFFTRAIGICETAMAIWIVSALFSRVNAITQIAIIATMNGLEFVLASDLLLWGRFNALFALLFILVIYFNEFRTSPKIPQPS